MPDLHARSFLKELDFTRDEWAHLLDLSAELKQARRERREQPRLAGRNIALIFEKTSTRTRCAFEVAAHDQGAHCTYLDPAGSQLGHKESIADTARVLGRMYDGIEYRGFEQERVETLAAHAGVPVWNGLTNEWHPTQMLADQLTIGEHLARPLGQVTIAYVGDARYNVGNSILVSSAMMGMDVRIVAPAEFQPASELVEQARQLARGSGGQVCITDDIDAGVKGADVIYTDVWVSMGEPRDAWVARVQALREYQVNAQMLVRSGNPEVRVMHCLPAFHDLDTTLGRQIYEGTGMDALEITDEVFQANAQVIFDQSENRMHTIKAVMVATIGD